MAGPASATIPAVTGTTSSAVRSRAQRSDRATRPGPNSRASVTISGSTAVLIGWASTAYGPRKITQPT